MADVGHGLNLQKGGASIIARMGPIWSYEFYKQANDRLHRQGQTNAVMVHHILAWDTIDDQVMARLDAKDTGSKSLFAALRA